jgi:hypothetical protein
MIRANSIVQDSPPETLPEIRDLVQEYPFFAHRGSETVRRALRALRGVAVSDFEVETAMEALRDEDGEVLA